MRPAGVVRRDGALERPLRRFRESSLWTGRAPLPTPLRIARDRGGDVSRRGVRVRLREPGASRTLRAPERLAVERARQAVTPETDLRETAAAAATNSLETAAASARPTKAPFQPAAIAARPSIDIPRRPPPRVASSSRRSGPSRNASAVDDDAAGSLGRAVEPGHELVPDRLGDARVGLHAHSGTDERHRRPGR